MGRQAGSDEQGDGQLPPRPGPTRAPAKPFWSWASGNRVKVAVAVLGGLALSVANAWGVTVFRPNGPRDLPDSAIIHIEAGADVCWSANLGLGNGTERGCGDATYYRIKPLPEEVPVYPPHLRFSAQVHKTYQKKVTGRVEIVLVVEGKIVDRASTRYESAAVSY